MFVHILMLFSISKPSPVCSLLPLHYHITYLACAVYKDFCFLSCRMNIEIDCPQGTYSRGSAMSCTICPAGAECPSATSTPTYCPAGEFSTGNQAQCTKCPKGHACPNSTTDDIIKCNPGFYSTGGQTRCTPCRAG